MVLKYHLFWVPRRKVLVGDVAARLERLLREKVEELDGDRKRYVEVDRFFPSGRLCGRYAEWSIQNSRFLRPLSLPTGSLAR